MSKRPDRAEKQRLEMRLRTKWQIPPGLAKILAKVDDNEASGEDIAQALIAHARTFKKKR